MRSLRYANCRSENSLRERTHFMMMAWHHHGGQICQWDEKDEWDESAIAVVPFAAKELSKL
jgi:hypothetical protein